MLAYHYLCWAFQLCFKRIVQNPNPHRTALCRTVRERRETLAATSERSSSTHTPEQIAASMPLSSSSRQAQSAPYSPLLQARCGNSTGLDNVVSLTRATFSKNEAPHPPTGQSSANNRAWGFRLDENKNSPCNSDNKNNTGKLFTCQVGSFQTIIPLQIPY